MPRIVLTRTAPVGLEEAAALPEGATVDNADGAGRVVYASDGADLTAFVRAAVALGRALPDAEVGLFDLDTLGARTSSARPTTRGTRPAPSDAALAPATSKAWELVDDGDLDGALAAFVGSALDSAGRDRVRSLLDSTDPEQVALACRIAAATDWRSFVSHMRRVLDHADTRVRRDAVRAIGALSGPAMIWHLQKLAEDPSPEVREAVDAAVAEIEDRQD